MDHDERAMRRMRRWRGMGELSGEEERFPERMFRRHGGLRFYILWLLSEKDMKGSEIMDEIEAQTKGWWKPSPGSIYPLLKSLEKESMIKRNEDGSYAISDRGREQIGWITGDAKRSPSRGQERLKQTILEIESLTSYLEDNRSELKEFSGKIKELRDRLSDIIGSFE